MTNVSLFDLLLRVGLSLGIVVGVLWVAARVVNGRSTSGRGRTRTARHNAPIEVVAQQRLGRRQSVAVVSTGGRSILIGITDQQITLLGEADHGTVDADVAMPSDAETDTSSITDANGRASSRGDAGGPVPAWKAALEDLRERTVRRA